MMLSSILLAAFLEASAQGANAHPETLIAPAAPAPAVAPSTTSAVIPKLSYTLFKINAPAIAMTFDDGPHAKNTPRLLDMLKERGIKATFFLIGKNVVEHPEIVRRIVLEGHEIANHTWDHKALRSMGFDAITTELQKTHDAIVTACGVAPVLYRPPFGMITTKQKQLVMDKFHYPAILWEVDTRDWQAPRNVAKVHDTIMKDTHAGSIILCHDIHEPTIDAMPTTLDELKAKGFQFKTISEMIKLEIDEVVSASKAVAKPAAAPTPAPVSVTTPPTEAAPVVKP